MRVLTFLIQFFLLFGVAAQSLNYIHYNTNNSKLPHNIIYGLRQDSENFLWISTDDGLVRFDGTKMESRDKGISSKYVIDTDVENGRIWICTWKGGIHYLKNDSAFLVKSVPNQDWSFSTNQITVFNDLIISHTFAPYVVFRYNPSKNQLSLIELKRKKTNNFVATPGDEEYYQFIKSKQHRLFAFNKRGVFEVIADSLVSLKSTLIPDLAWESPKGILYFLKDDGIYLMSKDLSSSRLIYKLPKEKFDIRLIKSFAVLPSGNLALSLENTSRTNSRALKNYYILNKQSGSVIDLASIIGTDILLGELLVDTEGSLWLGTDGHGLFHIFDPRFEQFGGDDKTFDNASITDLLPVGNDSLFVGTKEGFYLYTNKKFTLQRSNENCKNDYVNSLFLDNHNRPGVIYTGQSKCGLPLATLKNGVFKNSDSLAIVISTKNYYFTVNHMASFKLTSPDGKQNYTQYLKLNQLPYELEEDANKGLWISCARLLYYYHPNQGFKDLSALLPTGTFINCLLHDPDKGLWMGTDKGLILINKQGIIETWGLKEGLTNINIRCLLKEGNSNLWIGTQNGLFNFKNNKFNIYKKRDGLISDDVRCLSFNGKHQIAIGSSNGITFLRTPINNRPGTPSLFIEKLSVNSDETDWKTHANLPYNSSLSLEFNSVTFIYPELTLFEYRLNETDSWISTTNRSILLTNLKPGDYKLDIRVKNYNTDFSQPTSLNFSVKSPWWKSYYFFLILSLLALAVAFIILKIKLNKQKKEIKAKQELAELKLKALQAQLNPHFVSNALNAIQFFILKQDEVSANNYLSQFTDLTRLFLEVSRARFITLKKELDLLDNYLSLEKLRFEDKFNYEINIEPAIDINKTWLPGLLIQPFVENSINHGLVYLPKNSQGMVALNISRQNEYLSIIIDDNGVGREKSMEIKKQQGRSFRSHSGRIMEELQQAYDSLPGCSLSIQVTDKYNQQGEATGTRVNILVIISKQTI